MKTIQAVIAIILLAAIVSGAAYLGGWVCFIGGIVSVVDAIKATPVNGMGIATGLLRVLVAAPAFWISLAFGGIVAKIAWPSTKKIRSTSSPFRF